MSNKENSVDLLNLVDEEIVSSKKCKNDFEELENFDVIKALSKLAKINTNVEEDDVKIAKELIGNII